MRFCGSRQRLGSGRRAPPPPAGAESADDWSVDMDSQAGNLAAISRGHPPPRAAAGPTQRPPRRAQALSQRDVDDIAQSVERFLADEMRLEGAPPGALRGPRRIAAFRPTRPPAAAGRGGAAAAVGRVRRGGGGGGGGVRPAGGVRRAGARLAAALPRLQAQIPVAGERSTHPARRQRCRSAAPRQRLRPA